MKLIFRKYFLSFFALNFKYTSLVSVYFFCFVPISFFSVQTFAQIKQTQQPKFETLQPQKTGYYTNSSLNNPAINTLAYNMPIGANADDIIKQTNQQTLKMMGYEPPIVPPSDPYLAHQFIIEQAQQTSYSSGQQKELLKILNEAHSENSNNRSRNYSSPAFTTQTKSYTDALQALRNMLSGKSPLSIKDAYFNIESAYGNTYLTKKEYENRVNESADFIKQWLAQNGYDRKNNEALNMAIQRFMSDTLTITIKNPDDKNPTQTIKHFPFKYDYDDFKGEKDYRNYFITKSMATGTGQCNSLPGAYLVFAESVDAKAYLSFVPQHSFIKYPNAENKMNNYESTSNWHITDKWYEDHLFISPEAKRHKIYLDTLNKRQIIANCMTDLAFGYLNKFGAADGRFINECITAVMKEFPKNNNIYPYFMKSSLLSHLLEDKLSANGVKDLKDIDKIQGARELYEALQQNEAIITQLGYQEMPPKMYDEMMQQQEFKNKLQKAENTNTKEKKNLFVKSSN